MLSLDTILESLRSVLFEEFVSRGAKAVAVFGSAARGVDFIPCRSDIDVFAVVPEVNRFRSRIEVPELCLKISVALFTPQTLEKALEVVHPVLLHLYKTRVVFFDDGTLAATLSRIPPRIARSTVEIERLSTAAALALGLENLVIEELEAVLSHLHHALRHLARTLVGEGSPVTMFPVYDIEVETLFEQRDHGLAKLFRDVRRTRMMRIALVDDVKKLLIEVWNAVSQHLDIEIPRLDRVIEVCGNGRIPSIEIPLYVRREGVHLVFVCGSKTVEPDK